MGETRELAALVSSVVGHTPLPESLDRGLKRMRMAGRAGGVMV